MGTKQAKPSTPKQKPFISVVIPAYNEERYLPYCLLSLKDQDYPKDRYEIIVVDNNSKDQTAAIAKAGGAQVVTELKQGHVFALNAGMLQAKGEIIAGTDADTEVPKNWLKTIEKAFQDKNVVAATGPVHYKLDSRIKHYFVKYSYLFYLKSHFAVGKPSLAGFNLAVRRDAFHKINGLDTRYRIFSDVELGLRIKKLGKVAFCRDLYVLSSPRRWQKGSLEDYYKYFNSYFNTVWLQKPPKGDLTPRR